MNHFDQDPVEHTFHRPGSGSYPGEIPMFAPAWQYRIDHDGTLPPQTMHHPSCKGVWVYEPFSHADAEPTFEIMSDDEINRYDDQLAKWNAELSKFHGTTSTNHLGHSLWVLYSGVPIAPTGIDAPHIITLFDTPKIPTKTGQFEMHIAFDSEDAKEQYQEDADEILASLCEALEDIDLRRIDMSIETLAGLLCMLEVRRIIDELEGDMSVDVSRTVTDYAFIELKTRNDKVVMSAAQWAFAQAIYDAREPLNLFV